MIAIFVTTMNKQFLIDLQRGKIEEKKFLIITKNNILQLNIFQEIINNMILLFRKNFLLRLNLTTVQTLRKIILLKRFTKIKNRELTRRPQNYGLFPTVQNIYS